MKTYIRNTISVILGWLIGSVVNMSLINLGNKFFPMEGVDVSNFEEIAKFMKNAELEFFLFPFLAHALGTLVGAFIAASIALSHKMKFAFAVGFLFLLGGIVVNYMISGPVWFTLVDVLFAYIPMAFLGGMLAFKIFGFNKNE